MWILLLVIGCFSSSPLYAFGKSDVGTSGAAFLRVAPGARPVGMGEAFTGVADDLHSVYWNPAGLANLTVPEVAGMHMQYFQNIQYEFAGFAYPTQEHGTWGLAITNLHTDDLDRRTGDTDAPIGQFSSSDSAYWLSYARRLNAALSVGGNMKYIRQTLDSSKAQAFGADGGVLYETGWHDLRLGAAAQNFGTRVKFENESDPLPLTFRLGASAPVWDRKLLIASDLFIPRDNAVGIAFGGEYRKTLSRDISVAARSGYRTGANADGLTGVSAGGGLTVGRASFDFAWVPFGDLGNSYRFGLHLKLGEPGESPTPRRLQKLSHESPRDTTLESLLSQS